MDDTSGDQAVDYEADVQEADAPAKDAPAEQAEEAAAADAQPAEQAQAADAPAAEPQEPATNGAAAAAAPAEPAQPADPDNPLSFPPHGTELFVGGIPRTATEAQIREFAEQAGPVYSVKVMRDPGNPDANRGFGFVRYRTKEAAEAAKQTLHESELKGTGCKLRVSSSQAKHKLFLGNIPKTWSQEQLVQKLGALVKGIDAADVPESKEVTGQNRGFGFLAFYNHECAAAAKEVLGKPDFRLEGRQLTVSYAEPKHSEAQQSQPVPPGNKSVYVGRLPSGTTEEQLRAVFAKHGEIDRIVIPPPTERRPESRFGFVHYTESASADAAISDAAANKPHIDGSVLEVKAARPEERTHHLTRADQGGRRGGRGGPAASPQGRGGRGGYGYDQGGYGGGYDQGYGGYGGGSGQGGGYSGGYGGGMAPAAAPAGMTMVPMMLPSGQVGYVLQSQDPAAGAYGGSYGGGGGYGGDYGSYGADRSYGGGRGRGRGPPPRYRPY